MSIRSAVCVLVVCVLALAPVVLLAQEDEDNECMECHAERDGEAVFVDAVAYAGSVHGEVGCASCHQDTEDHPMERTGGVECAGCHDGYVEEVKASVHGGDNPANPRCIDCHYGHQVMPNGMEKQAIDNSQACIWCHGSELLDRRYLRAKGKVESYQESYHGLARKLGQTDPTTCSDCHGAHKILHSEDADSPTNSINLAGTCGKCHPDLDPKDIGVVHASTEHPKDPIVSVVRIIYIVLIILVIGGMLAFNMLDFIHYLVHSYRAHLKKPTVERMNMDMRLQHFGLMASFVILCLTGFALKFPEAFWVVPLTKIPNFWLFRFYLHRVAGAFFMLLCFYHLFFIIFKQRGRREVKAMLPGLQDAWDAVNTVLYLLGLKKEKPLIGRYGFVEKAEYWALVWGAVIMSATGLILWFYSWALSQWPKWVFDLSELVHYMEAALAGIAVLVWHGYHVYLHPKVYPINWVCMTGRMDEREYREEHPKDVVEEDK